MTGAAPLLRLLGAAAAAWQTSAAQPNLLLLFPDEWRGDFAGFDPSTADLRMPNLQALAAQGTRFTSAYTPSAWCAPARACLASVMDFDGSPKTMNGNDFPEGTPTWYTALREVGYHTMIAGKDDLSQSRLGTRMDGSRNVDSLGVDDWFRMQDKYITYRQTPWDQFGTAMASKPCGLYQSGKANLFEANRWCYGVFGRGACCNVVGPEGYDCPGFDQVGENQEDYIDNYVTAQAEALLSRAPPGRPWALHVSFPGPHPPFIITAAMNRSMSGRDFPVAEDNRKVRAEVQRAMRRQYAAEVENLDTLFGRLLAKVRAMGQETNTLVVVMSDHGEQLGDQHAFGKKMPWEASIRVPLVVAGPGVAAGRVVTLPVSTLDVVGTFLERADATVHPHWQARSLTPLLNALLPAADEEAYLAARPFVSTGLTYPGGAEGPAVNYRAVIKYVNKTHTLKVVCCPMGCPVGNSHVPSTAPEPQLLAINVAPGGAPPDTVNLEWSAEAKELALRHLPGLYATACISRSLQGPGGLPAALPGGGAVGPVSAAVIGVAIAVAVLLALCCCLWLTGEEHHPLLEWPQMGLRTGRYTRTRT